MAKKAASKRRVKSPVEKKSVSKNTDNENLDKDEFDFGGLPKGVSFKRNIGCGG